MIHRAGSGSRREITSATGLIRRARRRVTILHDKVSERKPWKWITSAEQGAVTGVSKRAAGSVVPDPGLH